MALPRGASSSSQLTERGRGALQTRRELRAAAHVAELNTPPALVPDAAVGARMSTSSEARKRTKRRAGLDYAVGPRAWRAR
ncbi:hypothetical protein ANANG_G00279580 [Anguilla anguilla]|uniref:Uncharacterized protein n=1 Tax=Anguilla anguilla TaxID=7936 RepID=A0A9D3RN74_ANGAN|nr:hypothetical protein ANANG_G00279580 [Anguilla anguilla]